jgi:hypothetical protein
MAIQLTSFFETKTKVQITSLPKTGVMFDGAFEMVKRAEETCIRFQQPLIIKLSKDSLTIRD